MRLVCIIPLFCAIITLSHVMTQLTLNSAKGGMKLKNFVHLHKHRLVVKPMASLEVAKEIKCTMSCTKSEECFSFNVKKLTDNSFLCEMLNTSKYVKAENLTQDNSFTDYYLQDPCVPAPCATGNCKSDKKGGFLCQCPVKMSGKKCDMCEDPQYNFALRKPTAQSSTYSYEHIILTSDLSVDGNRADAFLDPQSKPQCSATYDEPISWWKVDFGVTVAVARVAITNRGDCCWDRMRDFEIKVGDSSVDNGMVNPKCGNRYNIGVGTSTIKCEPIMSGRYLVIQSKTGIAINFCEVEVYCG